MKLQNCHKVLGLIKTLFMSFLSLKDCPRKKKNLGTILEHPGCELEHPKKNPVDQTDPVNKGGLS